MKKEFPVFKRGNKPNLEPYYVRNSLRSNVVVLMLGVIFLIVITFSYLTNPDFLGNLFRKNTLVLSIFIGVFSISFFVMISKCLDRSIKLEITDQYLKYNNEKINWNDIEDARVIQDRYHSGNLVLKVRGKKILWNIAYLELKPKELANMLCDYCPSSPRL